LERSSWSGDHKNHAWGIIITPTDLASSHMLATPFYLFYRLDRLAILTTADITPLQNWQVFSINETGSKSKIARVGSNPLGFLVY
jgi:hypothetical protein